jgi:hypothetical protein
MSRNIRLTQIDGKLPNLALMKLAKHHRGLSDNLHFTKRVERDMLEPKYDVVYGSAIFSFSADRVAKFRAEFPDAIIGGTHDVTSNRTVEQFLGVEENEEYDYSIYPRFDGSIGFTQRGCRLKCGFCVVPKKEGKPRSVNSIWSIWRRGHYPKHIHLLDNDFFGQPRDQWETRIDEIKSGGFKIRMIDDDSASALASVPYYDDGFKVRRLYTAWDNIGDEQRFFQGIDTLERHGIPSPHIMAYMLIGYDKRETWERLFHRFHKMTERGIRPYPMVFGDKNRTIPLGEFNPRIGRRTLGEFQRWVIRKAYAFVPFEAYDVNAKGHANTEQRDLFATQFC